ncbi:hypothetical protein [Mangrovimonas sp. TPBH4]|uniref:hypothetical protein n=1 Tax=Mangrovimonas sp. TPBH4 TaxID=1645914 RepID=UPI000A8797B7|nr:hypothetical protein [Mangrovimonas sp. TPBH4]
MKKLSIIIIGLLFSMNSYGFHKDQVYQKNFGNVKTYLRTPWNNYGSTVDVEIIGKLAQELAERLSYKDTIVLEFCHAPSFHLSPLTIVENGNPNQVYLINMDLHSIKQTQQKSYKTKNGKSAICIRQLNGEFDIWNTLKLLEYCIEHKFKSNLTQSKYDYPMNDLETKFDKIEFYGMSPLLIKTIFQKEKSNLLKELSKQNIEFLNVFKIKGYYYNEMYCFLSDKLKYNTKTLSYLIELKNGVCIFHTTNSFTYLSNSIQAQKSHMLDSEGYIPFYFFDYNLPDYKKGKSEILLTRPRSSKVFVFSEDKNEVIQSFEK